MTQDAAALEELRELSDAATQGPWFYNSYALVSGPGSMWVEYEAWTDTTGEHSLERYKPCEVCGPWTFEAGGKTHDGKGCKLHTEDYNRDPTVAFVPAHYGDTATGRHKADAELIAAAVNYVRDLLSEAP